MFRSLRTRLQAALVLLSGAAIAVTGWQASSGATAALREATYDRLDAIRETRARQLERYFTDVRSHVLALSTDETSVSAIEQFDAALATLPPAPPGGLAEYYASIGVPNAWLPEDPLTRTLQSFLIASNPHAHGNKDLLVDAPAAGLYGDIHARYHPTFHRYLMAFGFYDIFLIGADGRVLYTVMKEVDLGVPLRQAPYRETGLARVFERASQIELGGEPVIEDYTPYPPSASAPAAFAAAPIRRAGAVIGVLAIQVSIEEINNVMTGGMRWMEEGLGETGESYIVGADGTLRSDLRDGLEDPESFYRELAGAKVTGAVIDRIRRQKTGVLAFPADLTITQTIREGGTEIGHNLRGEEVLRSHSQLGIGGLNWTLIAEIETSEAFEAVTALHNKILATGFVTAVLFFAAASWLAVSVTRPIRAVASAARRLGQGDLNARVHIRTTGEIAQLADDFNRMGDDLQRTTVWKTELQALAGRLITAQEDERRRLARELHDDLTQRLAAVAIELGRLAKQPEASRDTAALTRLKDTMARISDDVHSLSRGLHPAMLDDLGLEAAIETECRAFLERGGAPVDFRTEGDVSKLSREITLTLYRIVQEGLHNIQRHADADEIVLRLRRAPEAVHLSIRDNGEGFDRTSPGWRPGLGLASMEERTRLLGGSWRVTSAPREGTTIEVSLPLSEHQPA